MFWSLLYNCEVLLDDDCLDYNTKVVPNASKWCRRKYSSSPQHWHFLCVVDEIAEKGQSTTTHSCVYKCYCYFASLYCDNADTVHRPSQLCLPWGHVRPFLLPCSLLCCVWFEVQFRWHSSSHASTQSKIYSIVEGHSSSLVLTIVSVLDLTSQNVYRQSVCFDHRPTGSITWPQMACFVRFWILRKGIKLRIISLQFSMLVLTNCADEPTVLFSPQNMASR